MLPTKGSRDGCVVDPVPGKTGDDNVPSLDDCLGVMDDRQDATDDRIRRLEDRLGGRNEAVDSLLQDLGDELRSISVMTVSHAEDVTREQMQQVWYRRSVEPRRESRAFC